MDPQKDLATLWQELSNLIDDLPLEEQTRFHNGVRMMVHDLRQNVSIIYGAESLLRRTIPDTEDNQELLDSIRTANQRIIGLITDLARPFDREITMPSRQRPKQSSPVDHIAE